MKTILMSLVGISFLCILFFQHGNAQVKTVDVGLIESGKPLISDLSLDEQVLKKNLPSSATVSDIEIVYAETEQQYYLTGRVSNDDIRAIGILLNKRGSVLSLTAGPGTVILCIGAAGCYDCVSKSSDGSDTCICRGPGSVHTGDCKMTSKTTIQL